MSFTEPVGNPIGDNEANTVEISERTLTTAENGFRRVLGTEGITDVQRREAELGLRQVDVARRLQEQQDDTRLNPALQGLFSSLAVINQPLGLIAGTANEVADIFRDNESFSLNDLFEDTTGITADDRSFAEKLAIAGQFFSPAPITFRDGIRFEQRDISLQGTFSDVIRDIPGENTGGAILRGTLGFGLDVAFDPLTYLGGTGLLVNAGETGIRQAGRRLTVNGVNRKVIASSFLEQSVKLAESGTPALQRQASQLAEIAHSVQRFGPNRARRSFDDELNELYSQYVYTGLTLRRPFRGTQARIRGVAKSDLSQARAIGGANSRVLRDARALGDVLAEPLLRVTPTQRGYARVVRNTDAEGFLQFFEAEGILARGHVYAGSWLGNNVQRFTELLPGIELNDVGQIQARDRGTLARFNQPEVAQAFREAIEAGQTTGTVRTASGDEFDIGWFTGFLRELNEDLRKQGVPVGDVENFFPRSLAINDELADDAARWAQATNPEKRTMLRQRKWAPGSPIGIDPETGQAIVLKDGTLAEVEAAFELMGESFENPFRNDLVGLMYSYLQGTADAVKRAYVDVELTAIGAKVSRDHANGKANIRFLQNTRGLRVFDKPEVQRVFSKLLGPVNLREQAIQYTTDAIPGRIRELRARRAELREQAIGAISDRDQLRQSLQESAEGFTATAPRRKNAQTIIRQLNEVVDIQERVWRAQAELENIAGAREVVAGAGDADNLVASSQRRLDKAERRAQEVLSQAEADLEIMLPAAEGVLRAAADPVLDQYYATARELADINANDVRKFSPCNNIIDEVISQLNLVNKANRSQAKRLRLIKNQTVRGEVIKAITNARVGEMVDTVKAQISNGALTKAEFEIIEPALREMENLVRFDSISLRTFESAPMDMPRLLRQRAEDFEHQSVTSGTRNAGEQRLKDHLFQAARLMDSAARLMDEANKFHRALADMPSDTPAASVKEFENQAKARMIYAQEAAAHAELAAMGTPFSGERLMKFMKNMSDRQWQAIVNNMSRDADSLIKIKGTADLAASEEIAEMLNWKAQMMSLDKNEFSKRMEQLFDGLSVVGAPLRRGFAPAALLSPSFSIRNMLSAAHMNGVVGGLWSPADYGNYRDMLIGVRRERMGVENPFEGLNVSERNQEIARAIFEFMDDNQGVVADRLDTLADNIPRTGSQGESSLREAARTAGNAYFLPIAAAGQVMDRSTAAFFTQRGRIRHVAPTKRIRGQQTLDQAEDYGVEEFMRFSMAAHMMVDGGLGVRAAIDNLVKTHFDYADLSVWDRRLRDTTFPFWTFMSRNLPLQIEMLAKRPGAFNNLIAWQEQTYDRNDEGGANPSYHNSELHFSIPEEVWLLGGDKLTPDLAFNDLINRVNDLGETANLHFDEYGVANVGGTNPLSGLRMILNESSPWTKVWFELQSGQDTFTGRSITGMEVPITDSIDPAVSAVLGSMFADIGWARHDPINGDLNNRRWVFDERANQVLRSFLPILSRLEGLNAQEDTRFKRRQQASWISFMLGGVRTTGPTDDMIAAFELSDEAQELLQELENYAVPDTDELGSRGSVVSGTVLTG